MFFLRKRSTLRMLRPIHISRYAIGLFFAFIFFANAAVAEGPRSRFAEALKPVEAHSFLQSFRAQRLQGDYVFKFQLEHMPRRGRTVRYEGTLWGSSNENGPVTRFAIEPHPLNQVNESTEAIEWIVQNGEYQAVWMRQGSGANFEPIDTTVLMEPLFEGVLYRPFDLLMPFIYWDEYEYEGPKAIGSRLVHQFLMKPPVELNLPQVHAVRLSLDSEYRALMRIEVFDTNGAVLTRLEVESFKKVQEQYVVKRITLGERASGERTRFRVTAAAVGLSLPIHIFEAEKNSEALPIPLDELTEL